MKILHKDNLARDFAGITGHLKLELGNFAKDERVRDFGIFYLRSGFWENDTLNALRPVKNTKYNIFEF